MDTWTGVTTLGVNKAKWTGSKYQESGKIIIMLVVLTTETCHKDTHTQYQVCLTKVTKRFFFSQPWEETLQTMWSEKTTSVENSSFFSFIMSINNVVVHLFFSWSHLTLESFQMQDLIVFSSESYGADIKYDLFILTI